MGRYVQLEQPGTSLHQPEAKIIVAAYDAFVCLQQLKFAGEQMLPRFQRKPIGFVEVL